MTLKEIINLTKDGYRINIAVDDCRHGACESTHNGAYVWRAQFCSPIPGLYLYRLLCSCHGDLVPFPKWEEVSPYNFILFLRGALDLNATLEEEDLYGIIDVIPTNDYQFDYIELSYNRKDNRKYCRRKRRYQ